MKIKRVFLIVLDSLGIGGAPDAAQYGDQGSNTLAAISRSPACSLPNMRRLGLYHIDEVSSASNTSPTGMYGRLRELSQGKDTTTGHWEMAGIITEKAFDVFPEGFPQDFIRAFERETGVGTLCNLPYSGTKVIEDYGQEHIRTGKLIVYTSADSVFQIAAHEQSFGLLRLYDCCATARRLLNEHYHVGRVIARPFEGEFPHFTRTANRHDYALTPPAPTMLNCIGDAGLDVLCVGKISDIFAGDGVTESFPVKGNQLGMEQTRILSERDFHGLCFVNLVDFDMLYGHRNDVDGYAQALTDFDTWLGDFLPRLNAEDVLIITGDHGCDPSTPSTDHSREDVPVLLYGREITPKNLGTRAGFCDIAASVCHLLGVPYQGPGNSMIE